MLEQSVGSKLNQKRLEATLQCTGVYIAPPLGPSDALVSIPWPRAMLRVWQIATSRELVVSTLTSLLKINRLKVLKAAGWWWRQRQHLL